MNSNIRVLQFKTALELENFLNKLATDLNNRYDIRYLMEGPNGYTGVFVFLTPSAAPVASTTAA